jgi:DNA-binding GntR family transcriptional regulator
MAYVNKKNNSKQEFAYNKIKNLIIKNEIKPDTLLVERQLCETLGVSRTPVREALRRLASEGMIELIPEKGAFVSRIRFEDLMEIFEIREALEGMAVRLCTLRKREDTVKQMEESIALQEKTLELGDRGSSVERDLDFHSIYIRGSRNSRLEGFLKTITDQINRFAITTVDDIERQRLSLEQHKRILEAVKNNDAESAEKLVREHIVNVKEYHVSRHYLY